MHGILATQEAETGKIAVPGQPQEDVHKNLSQAIKSRMWWHTSVIPAMQEA
jgi:hypothetical protein